MERQPANGTRVEIVDAGLLPSIRSYVGRQGFTERAELDGCYVRFPDHAYVFCYWPEVKAVCARGETE